MSGAAVERVVRKARWARMRRRRRCWRWVYSLVLAGLIGAHTMALLDTPRVEVVFIGAMGDPGGPR